MLSVLFMGRSTDMKGTRPEQGHDRGGPALPLFLPSHFASVGLLRVIYKTETKITSFHCVGEGS